MLKWVCNWQAGTFGHILILHKQQPAEFSSDTWMLVSLLHVFLALTIKIKNFLTAHIIGRSCMYNILPLEMQCSYVKIKEKMFR